MTKIFFLNVGDLFSYARDYKERKKVVMWML